MQQLSHNGPWTHECYFEVVNLYVGTSSENIIMIIIMINIIIMLCLRQGWDLFERTCVFAGIQFTKHYIEIVFVETNELVSSNSNLILTRQEA